MDSQIPPQRLLPLKSLKQTLEVARSESVKVIALDHLHKDSGSVPDVLCEYLQQVPVLVEVDQDIEPFEHVHVC